MVLLSTNTNQLPDLRRHKIDRIAAKLNHMCHGQSMIHLGPWSSLMRDSKNHVILIARMEYQYYQYHPLRGLFQKPCNLTRAHVILLQLLRVISHYTPKIPLCIPRFNYSIPKNPKVVSTINQHENQVSCAPTSLKKNPNMHPTKSH